MLMYLPSAWWWRAVWKPGRQTFLPPYSELWPCSGLPSHLSFKHTQSDVTSLLLLCSVGTPSFIEWTISWLHAHCDSHLMGTEHIFVSIYMLRCKHPAFWNCDHVICSISHTQAPFFFFFFFLMSLSSKLNYPVWWLKYTDLTWWLLSLCSGWQHILGDN